MRLELAPSPKVQDRLVIVPVEVSVNVTVNGTAPVAELALNNAAGKTAPLPGDDIGGIADVGRKHHGPGKAPHARRCEIDDHIARAAAGQGVGSAAHDGERRGRGHRANQLPSAVLVTTKVVCVVVPVVSAPKLKFAGDIP